ncbi:MAG: cytosine permease [Nitrososphaeria archaeon]|nr:cytosine permease [Nitrososphaeria archaeon]
MGLIRLPPEWGIEPVPENLRRLRAIDIFVFWTSLSIGLLVLQAGALLTQGLSLPFTYSSLIIVLGSIVGSLILALVGVIGTSYGVPTMVSLRPVFGREGSYVPTILNVIQLIGWTSFELIIMGEAASTISGPLLGDYTKFLWMIFFAIICYFMMVFGPLIVIRQWLEKFALWISLATTCWITFQIIQHPIDLTWGSVGLDSLLLAFDIVVAMPISWMPLVSDYNRFASTRKGGFIGTFLGYTFANVWFYTLGAALALIGGTESIVYSIALMLLGNIALFALLVDETDNAFADIYSAAVSLQNIFSKQRQWFIGLIITVASTIIAVSTPIMAYEWFLLLIGASFIPVFGIAFSDYYLVNRGKYDSRTFLSPTNRVNFVAIVSWILGFISYWYFSYIIGLGGTVPSFITAFTVYTAAKKVIIK